MVTLSLLLVDDHAPTREAMRRLIEAGGCFNVIAEAEHGASAVSLTAALKPDVVVIDAQMPIMDGFEATRQILAHNPGIIVVVTSALGDAERMAREAGACGFVGKWGAAESLLKTLNAVCARVRPNS